MLLFSKYSSIKQSSNEKINEKKGLIEKYNYIFFIKLKKVSFKKKIKKSYRLVSLML